MAVLRSRCWKSWLNGSKRRSASTCSNIRKSAVLRNCQVVCTMCSSTSGVTLTPVSADSRSIFWTLSRKSLHPARCGSVWQVAGKIDAARCLPNGSIPGIPCAADAPLPNTMTGNFPVQSCKSDCIESISFIVCTPCPAFLPKARAHLNAAARIGQRGDPSRVSTVRHASQPSPRLVSQAATRAARCTASSLGAQRIAAALASKLTG